MVSQKVIFKGLGLKRYAANSAVILTRYFRKAPSAPHHGQLHF